MKNRALTMFVTLTLLVAVVAGSAFAAAGVDFPGKNIRHDYTEAPGVYAQAEYAIVTFKDPPVASYEGGVPGFPPTKPEKGKLDPDQAHVKGYVRHLNNVHANYRSWLARNAPRVEVVGNYVYTMNALAIRLNNNSKDKLKLGPGVRSVEFSWLYQPAMNVSAGLISATDLWPLVGGRENAGAGIKVGIIDSGIDDTHEFFACKTGIEHKVYASGKAGDPNNILVSDHGTHVAGTVAGCVIVISGPVSGEISGLAPAAELWDYNVFPGFGAGWIAHDGSAFSHDIANALEDAVEDGMDVVNMSLSGGVQGQHDYLSEAVNATRDAGVVVAVAAGNAGPGDMTVGSPGNAEGALTAGASTNPHFVGIPVTVSNVGVFGAALGDFNNFLPPVVGASFTLTTPANGCTEIAEDLTGLIAVIDRGACTFGAKIRNAEAKGALGVIIANNVAGDPTAMGTDGLAFPNIPAAMVSKDDGMAIKAAAGVELMDVDGTNPAEFVTANADIIAGFSSRGPTPFTYLIKPDVTAPGVNVYSSVFNGEFAFFNGTSMASPHLAGSAALLLQLHPDWSPDEVKSALVNTAERVVTDSQTGTVDAGVLARGNGRVNLEYANVTPLLFAPVSASFGFWNGNGYIRDSMEVGVKNVSGVDQTCGVLVTGPDKVSASTDTLSIPAGLATSFELALDAGRSRETPTGDYDGDVVVTCGSTTLLMPWWFRVDREGKP